MAGASSSASRLSSLAAYTDGSAIPWVMHRTVALAGGRIDSSTLQTRTAVAYLGASTRAFSWLPSSRVALSSAARR